MGTPIFLAMPPHDGLAASLALHRDGSGSEVRVGGQHAGTTLAAPDRDPPGDPLRICQVR